MAREQDEGGGRGVAVVTGASAGVGRATALALAEAGFDVGLLARGAAGLEGARRDVEARGRRALVLQADVSDAAAVEAAAARVEAELGPIEVWVNDAMTTVFQRVVDTEPEDFRRAVEVTFLGQVWGTQAALRRMRPRDRGHVVNIGSSLAFLGIPLQAAYCASKFACHGFLQSARAELREEGSNVRLSMVHLPAVNTPQFDWCQSDQATMPQPVPPIYAPERAADAIVEVCLDGRPAKVFGVWNALVVVAASLVPGVAERFAALTGAASQLTDVPADPDRPFDLWKPVDEDRDVGAHGRFGDRSGGMFDPSYLKGLPGTLKALGQAVVQTVAAGGR